MSVLFPSVCFSLRLLLLPLFSNNSSHLYIIQAKREVYIGFSSRVKECLEDIYDDHEGVQRVSCEKQEERQRDNVRSRCEEQSMRVDMESGMSLTRKGMYC